MKGVLIKLGLCSKSDISCVPAIYSFFFKLISILSVCRSGSAMPLMCLVLSWFYPPLMLIRQSHAKSETLGKIWYAPKCAASLQSDTLRRPTVPNNLWERPSALLLTYWMIGPVTRAQRSLKGAGNELQITLSPGSFQETSRRILGLSHFSCKVNLQMVMLWNQAHSIFFDLCHQCLTHAFFLAVHSPCNSRNWFSENQWLVEIFFLPTILICKNLPYFNRSSRNMKLRAAASSTIL